MTTPSINPGALNVAGVEAATDAIMALCGATNGVNSRDIYREDARAAIEAYLQAAPSEPQEDRGGSSKRDDTVRTLHFLIDRCTPRFHELVCQAIHPSKIKMALEDVLDLLREPDKRRPTNGN